MQKKFHVSVSKHKVFRVKAKAQVHLRGYVKVQYSLLRDYANELQRCNPYTTVKIDVYRKEDPEKTTRMFRRIYVCLGALKRGFKEGGRELFSLDGGFMRGQYHGQMLTVVGVDANNGIYPVAYGIVESENQYYWTWFLTCLANDFDLFSNSIFTFITDKQKGLLSTIAKLFSSAEHSFCVRHINENMNLTWERGDYKEIKWKISSIPCKHAIAAIHDMADNVNSRYMWSKFECSTTLHPPEDHPKKERKAKIAKLLVQGDGGQMNDMPSETVPTEHVASEHVGSQPVGSQPVASQPLSSQPVASQPLSSQLVARKLVGRKPAARKPVQNKSVAKKRAASEISNATNQAAIVTSESATQGSQAATQATIAYKDSSNAFLDLRKPGMIGTARTHIGGSTQAKIGHVD
ncbi:mutator type transposase [Tanacetum coccineum]